MSQQQQQSEAVGNGITTNSNFVSLRLIFKGFLKSKALNFNIQTTIKTADGRDGPGKEKIHNYSIE